MPAPLSRVQIFYNYKSRGFSEILWSSLPADQVANPSTSIVSTPITNYLAKRLPLMDDDCEAVYARASVFGSPRRFSIQPLLGKGYVGKLGGNGSAPDDVVSCRMFGANGAQGLLHLHAFPATIVKENSVTNLGAWGNALNTFGDYLISLANGWLCNSSLNPGGGMRTYFQINGVVAGPGRGFTAIADTGVTFPTLLPGTVVTFSQMGANQFGMNGRKIVLASTGGLITVGGAQPVGSVAAHQGRFAVLGFTGVPILQFVPYALAERKTGKVFGVPAGRRRNTLSLRR